MIPILLGYVFSKKVIYPYDKQGYFGGFIITYYTRRILIKIDIFLDITEKENGYEKTFIFSATKYLSC